MRPTFLLLVLALALPSCAVRRPVPGMIPTAPAKAAPIAPAVAAARADAAATDAVSQRLETQVAVLKRSAETLQGSLAKSFVEASRLRDQKSASEQELNGLYMSLGDSKALTQSLVDEVAVARSTADEQAALRLKAEKDRDDLFVAAAAKDAENATLRSQNTDLGATVTRLNGDVRTLSAAKEKSDKNAAVGGFLKGCVWFLAVAAIGFLVLWMYFPRIKIPPNPILPT